MKKVSMQNIADRLGITKALVSLALSNKYGVNESTRAQVITTAIEMGYDFNRIKTVKHTKKTKITLLLMQADLTLNSFWNEIICSIERRCNELNFDLTIKIWNNDNIENQVFSSVFDDKTQGIIALNHFPIDILTQCKRLKIPLVLIDSVKYFGCEFNHIRINNYDGGYNAAKYLYDHGHRKILFLGNPHYAYSLKERYRGFKDFVSKKKEVNCIFVIDDAPANKLYFDDNFWQNFLSTNPTAIMCINDAVAKNLYADLNNRGFKIGTDISVMTFDCSVETEYLLPKITGIFFDKKNFGIETINLLKECIENETTTPKTVLLPTFLRECDSVRSI